MQLLKMPARRLSCTAAGLTKRCNPAKNDVSALHS